MLLHDFPRYTTSSPAAKASFLFITKQVEAYNNTFPTRAAYLKGRVAPASEQSASLFLKSSRNSTNIELTLRVSCYVSRPTRFPYNKTDERLKNVASIAIAIVNGMTRPMPQTEKR